MSEWNAGELRKRLDRWKNFERWERTWSARERRTRLEWLDWAQGEAEARGVGAPPAHDDPDLLAMRRRVREGLARAFG
jgi:hypothetical protein